MASCSQYLCPNWGFTPALQDVSLLMKGDKNQFILALWDGVSVGGGVW